MRRIGSFVGLLAIVATLGAPALVTPAMAADPDPDCAPAGAIRFICGRSGAEDLLHIPGTDWVVASAFSGAVGLRLLSVRDERGVATLYPSAAARKQQDMATYGACPGPLSAEDEAMFVSHGIALKKATDQSYTLYVVHHGSRESIEVFNLDVPNGQRPLVTWIGCVVAPDTAVLNSVAALPEGGFVTTRSAERNPDWKIPAELIVREIIGDPMINSRAPGMLEKRAAGENTGYVLEWHPQSGWEKVPGSDSSGPNGIEVSKDGKFIYVPTPGNRKLFRLTRGQTPPVRDEVEIGRSDNIRWTPDGKKLLFPVSTPGVEGSKIVAIDPDTLEKTDVVGWPGPATVGIQVGNDMWITWALIQRVAIVPIPPAPR